jgi:hypothetical protein
MAFLQPSKTSLAPEPLTTSPELLGIHLQLDNANTITEHIV